MIKIINPCQCEVNTRYSNTIQIANAFCKIKINKEGILSIIGVVGPTRNGDAKGSCGQCIDEIRQGTPTENWTDEMLQKFCDIWNLWHLNDMRAYCHHQKSLDGTNILKKKSKLKRGLLQEKPWKKKEKQKVERLNV